MGKKTQSNNNRQTASNLECFQKLFKRNCLRDQAIKVALLDIKREGRSICWQVVLIDDDEKAFFVGRHIIKLGR
jgi:hypothetical protein